MGHLIIMANEIVTRCEENNVLSSYLKSNLDEESMQKWDDFVSSKLDEINKKQQLTLVSYSRNYLLVM